MATSDEAKLGHTATTKRLFDDRVARARAIGLPEGAGRAGAASESPGSRIFAWLPVGVNSNKPARGSVSLI